MDFLDHRTYLIKKSDIQREPELVLEADFIGQLITELPRRRRGISQQCLRVAIHESYRQHDRLLAFGGLQFEPGRRLVSGAIVESPTQPLLAVGRVTRGPLPNERPKIVDEALRGGEAAHAQRQQNPASSVRRLVRVVGQLFADLAVDFVSELRPKDTVADDEVQFLQVGRRTGFKPALIRVGCVLLVLESATDVLTELVLAFQSQGDQLVANGPWFLFQEGFLRKETFVSPTVAI